MRFSPVQVLLLLAITTSAFGFRFFKLQHNEEGLVSNVVTPPTDGPSPMDCTICTVLVLLSENYAVSHNVSVDDFIENKLCGFFKEPLLTFCTNFVSNYGPAIINSLKNDTSPDDACKNAALCFQNSTCQLVPKNQTFDLFFKNPEMTPNPNFKGLTWDPWQEFLKIIEQFANNHRPDVDLDNDTFSQFDATARGYNWKGKDCNDFDASVYPGQKTGKDDFNCNGIEGLNETSGVSWKDQLCNNTGQIGFAVIGDSVGAHFELPPQWFNASMWNSTTFDDFLPRGLDEFDLPQYSGWTGYLNRTDGLPSNSIYKYLFQQNHCNMRDYQNAGVNGCDSNLEQTYIKGAFRRNPTDEPVIVILELIGNDVCHNPQFMTSVQQFQINILNLLNYLDDILPPGSHVMSVGLVDGRVLWDILWNRTHPLGVTYADLYDYMVCQNISPCPGWMNSNQTIRNATSARAAELNQVYQQIIASGQTWKNFDYVYYDFPDEEIMADYTIEGGEPYQLIEPVDGFHPNQIFHSMIGDYFWNVLQKDHPDWIGVPNPNNALIAQLFGDQGGY